MYAVNVAYILCYCVFAEEMNDVFELNATRVRKEEYGLDFE